MYVAPGLSRASGRRAEARRYVCGAVPAFKSARSGAGRRVPAI